MVSLQSTASGWFPAPVSMRTWMIRQTSAPWTRPRPTSRPSIAALAPQMVAMRREDCPPGWDYCCCHCLPHWGNYANEAAEELVESRRRRLHLITAWSKLLKWISSMKLKKSFRLIGAHKILNLIFSKFVTSTIFLVTWHCCTKASHIRYIYTILYHVICITNNDGNLGENRTTWCVYVM